MMIWSGLSPDLVQACIPVPDMLGQVKAVLGSYVRAEIPAVYHLKAMAQLATHPTDRVLDNRNMDNSAQRDDHLIASLINGCAIHQHQDCCHKLPHGKCSCRLGFKKELTDNNGGIKVVELFKTEDNQLEGQECEECDIGPTEVQRRKLSQQPLPLTSKRMFAVNPARPRIDKDHYSLENLEKLIAEGNGQFTEEQVKEWIDIVEGLEPYDKKILLEVLQTRNAAVVDFSPTATQALRCNTAAYLLGSLEQSKSIIFYLIKYITKDSTKVTTCLTMIRDARNKINKYASKAADSGTQKRSGQHIMQVLINKFVGMAELADTQAACCLLGMPAQFGTSKTGYIFIKSAMAYVQSNLDSDSKVGPNKRAHEDSHADMDGIFDDLDDDDDNDDSESDRSEGSEVDEEALFTDLGYDAQQVQTMCSEGWSGVPKYTNIHGKVEFVPQHVDYAHRGEALSDMNLFEYVQCVQTVPKFKKNEEEEDQGTSPYLTILPSPH